MSLFCFVKVVRHRAVTVGDSGLVENCEKTGKFLLQLMTS